MIVPAFMFRNVYYVTPKLNELRNSKQEIKDFKTVASRNPENLVSFREAYRFACALQHCRTVRDVIERQDPDNKLNPRRLVNFLIDKGMLTRVYKFPYFSGDHQNSTDKPETCSLPAFVRSSCDGNTAFDDICCKLKVNAVELDEWIADEQLVQVLMKKDENVV